jgi:FkbM family methyltransferase
LGYDLWPPELRRATKPWTLVDVGANEGEFTAAAAYLAKLQGVYAFEPQPKCHQELLRVLATVPNGRLHPAAVGARHGETELLCTANSKMASVLAPEPLVTHGYAAGDFAVINRVKVPLVRLDDVIPSGTAIGLLKIDVQGYEISVLEGAKTSLRSTFALLLEVNYVAHYDGGVTFDAVHETIRSHGFRTFGISAPYGGKDGPMWADALFVRDSTRI